MKTKKPSAADRTVSMFAAHVPIDERPVEVIDDEVHEGQRVPLEQDVDRLREQAFLGQEWTTKAFGIPNAEGNDYRVSKRGQHYYLETLSRVPGVPAAYGYVGVMLHERDLFAATAVLVQAVRDKQKRDNDAKPSVV